MHKKPLWYFVGIYSALCGKKRQFEFQFVAQNIPSNRQSRTHTEFNAPQKPFGKNLVLLKVVFPEPLLTNRGQRNTKNENPSPFL